jgi:hypothetical protein
MEETLVPLNDGIMPPNKAPSRSNSFGSDKGIDLHHEGEQDTLDYRIHAKHQGEGKTISLWHDISLVHIDPETSKETPYYNFVCEIPKFTRYVSNCRTYTCHVVVVGRSVVDKGCCRSFDTNVQKISSYLCLHFLVF